MDYKEIKRRERRVNAKKNSKKIISICTITTLLFVILAFAGYSMITKISSRTGNISTETQPQPTNESATIVSSPTPSAEVIEAVPTPTPTPTPTPISRRGTAQPIPPEIRAYMTGLSYKPNNNISLDDLSYLTIPHYDFNYNVQEGHLVVNKSLADDVLDIFAELYDIKYPIERMELVDNYNASDYESIEYNNTSAFNYRESTSGSGKLSKHALGRAIDINPQINPYVKSNGTGAHQNAAEYWSRDRSKWTKDIAKAAYIGTDAEIYNIFVAHGWTWGGHWANYRDYQHFEK